MSRILLKGLSFFILCAFGSPVVVTNASFDAVVGNAGTDSRAAHFATIGEALAAARDEGPWRVLVGEGLHREKLVVTRPDVHLVGMGRDNTVISWDDTGSTVGPDGEPLGTWGSATLTVRAPGFHLENLTVENAFDYPSNAALPADDPKRVGAMQAVALMTTGDSDRSVFRRVTLRGYQDTLFIDAGRHWFEDCRILGHVDFIFGAGQAVFKDCDIVSRNRANKNPTGYVTAPSTHQSQEFGFLFLESRFLKEEPDLPADSVRLGRPWHPHADPQVNGSAVFMRCFMDDHIGPEGYAPISGVNAAGERVWFEVGPDSRFFEFENHGPGAEASLQRPRLTPEQAERYTVERVLDGWTPE